MARTRAATPNLQKNSSYPLRHTTGAYSWEPSLRLIRTAPQIMARTSEAGNNRIVLGVHYPLDIMGGRIGASAQNGHLAPTNSLRPSCPRRQLRDYLVSRCAAGWPPAPSPPASAQGLPVQAATPTIFWTQWPPSRSWTKPRPVRVYTARLTYLPQDTAQSALISWPRAGAAGDAATGLSRTARRSAQRDFESHRLGFRIPPMAIERRLAAYQLGQSPVRPRHLG